MKRALMGFMRFYKMAISPYLGSNCRYVPTCSEYAYEAISKYGAWKGSGMAIRRLLRCHPFHKGGFDPVP